MVKTFVMLAAELGRRFLASAFLVLLFEVAGVVLAAVALAHFGAWAAELWVAFALVLKAFELDVARQRRRAG